MSNKIINVVLMEKLVDDTRFGGMTSIAVQENNQDTVDLIEQAANELVVGLLENVCQSAMIVDDSGIELISDLMESVKKVDWINSEYRFVNTFSTKVRFSIALTDDEADAVSSDLSFIVEKSSILNTKKEKPFTVKGMTKQIAVN